MTAKTDKPKATVSARKFKADARMFAKMRRQKKQRTKIGATYQLDIVAAPKGPAISDKHIRKDAFTGNRRIARWEDAEQDTYDYLPSDYESGVRAARRGLKMPANASRQAREGFVNQHRESLRVAVAMLASYGNKDASKLWRMRRRLAALALVQDGRFYSTQDAISALQNDDVLLSRVLQGIARSAHKRIHGV